MGDTLRAGELFGFGEGRAVPAETILSRFFRQERIRPNAPAYYVWRNEAWLPTTWRAYVEEVRLAARALHGWGIGAGEAGCILGFNRPEWVVMDLAAMAVGGVPAGIYTTCSPGEVQYIVEHAEAPLILVENREQWEKVRQERHRLPKLRHVVMMRAAESVEDPMVLSWDAFLARGESVEEGRVEESVKALQPDQVATQIYTSGTTGPPKGVMLTHGNLAWTARIARGLVNLGPDDCTLSYLPLSHIAEQMFTLHGPVSGGCAVYFAESLDALPENLRSVQPTVFFGVPRIWEKLYTGIVNKLKLADGPKAQLIKWAQGVGREVAAQKNQKSTLSPLLQARYLVANRLVFSPLKEAVGLGKARMCISGAAPIAQEVLEFFAGFDVIVHEVYGQSEGCGPTAFNVPGRTRYGTVGPILPGVKVKWGEDGEILVKGPNVFAGYFKDEETTRETLVDGWLHSGDLGEGDSAGFLSITGRKKDIIITAGGKNIAPKNIEAAIKNTDIVGEAVVIGDRRKYLSALISLDPEELERFAHSHGMSVDDAWGSGVTRDYLQAEIDAVNEAFARVEHVRKFTILDRPLSVEAGELTATLKVKRKVVNEHFGDEIEAMYEG